MPVKSKLNLKLKISDLWNWRGTIDRGPYAFWGLLLLALKHNIDRIIAFAVYRKYWGPLDYFVPATQGSLLSLTKQDIHFYALLLLVAIPFIYTGTVMTVRRLRSVQFPAWLVFFFFIPVVNLLFFFVLSVLPAASPVVTRKRAPGRIRGAVDKIIPDNAVGSAALALLVNLISGVSFTLFSVQALKNYGWGLFVGMPFCLGLTSVLIYGYHARRTIGQCIAVSVLSVALVSVGLIAFALEGLVCLIMAAPLAALLAMVGGIIGYAIQFHPDHQEYSPQVLSILLIVLPLLMTGEHIQATQPSEFCVRSSILIHASPEQVWKNVVSFSDLPEPHEWVFKIGIAYPMRARIDGAGVGAVRHCVFSTGAFDEPIQVWNEPSLLKFSVTSNPAPMQEWTPYRAIHPPHLKGFLESHGGQFRLIPMPHGDTLLEGTTWYQHTLWPESYWKLWSDYLIHKIHLRVLNHIKHESETSITNPQT